MNEACSAFGAQQFRGFLYRSIGFCPDFRLMVHAVPVLPWLETLRCALWLNLVLLYLIKHAHSVGICVTQLDPKLLERGLAAASGTVMISGCRLLIVTCQIRSFFIILVGDEGRRFFRPPDFGGYRLREVS